ncbi:MAG: gliding motility protein GldN [Dysgonamonadaceae bacterium]|jgi:gliding motility associated protien GldN|nr:gliding motility protein GldN [Dysgonamonadaceae bacterium]
MKPIYFFSLLFVFSTYICAGFAQNQPDSRSQQIQSQIEEQRRLQAERNQYRQYSPAELNEQAQPAPARTRQHSPEAVPDQMPALTERAVLKNMDNSREPVKPVWLREMYRIIDLNKDNNAALKYPVQPIGDRVNLFSLLFKLLSENKIASYAYTDKTEVLTDAGKIPFEEVLKSNQIPYTTQGSGENRKYVIDEIDVPSEDVSQYLIKEGWFFDQATGSFNTRITAICPIIVRLDYSDNTFHRSPVCWVLYENIRPYLSREMIMTSDLNNALIYTMDDFFTKKMYLGDIIKTVNLKNQSLQEQVGSDPDVLKHAQDSIEEQLKFFRKQLWVQADTATVVTNKTVKNTTDAKTGKENSRKSEKVKAPKTKVDKSSSTPTRSVRRTR